MDKIKEKIELLKSENNKFFEELIDSINKKLANNNAKIPNKYEKLLSLISNEYINQDNPAKTKELLNEFIEKEPLEKIHNFMLSLNSWYFDTKLLRKLQKSNKYLMFNFFEVAMDNFILQIDDLFIEKIKSIVLNFEINDDEIKNCLQALDYSADFYISRFMSKSLISKDFCEKSGVDKESADYFAELIIKNKSEIKTNYIIKKLKLLGSKL